MKHRIFTSFLLALLCIAVPAYAIVGKIPRKADEQPQPDRPAFTCTPAGFTLQKEDAGFHLKGSITAPTAGYVAEVEEEEPGPDGSLHATLHMKKPEGAAAQVISQVAVDHIFPGDGDRLTVVIDKPYKMGDDKIECKVAEAAQ